MFDPDVLCFFAHTWLADRQHYVTVCFRSADKGYTWEKVPVILKHPYGKPLLVIKDCHPLMRMADEKTLLAAMSATGYAQGSKQNGPAIYRSTDQGITWEYVGLGRAQPEGRVPGRFTYSALLRLPVAGRDHLYRLLFHEGRRQRVRRHAVYRRQHLPHSGVTGS